MELACNAVVPGLGCDFVARGERVDEVHAAMMAHGGEAHSDLMAGMSVEEMQQKKQEMDAHIRQLIVAAN
jgi:predicted small metal-binding protein